MSPRVSACIITCNEQDLLPRCLDSVAWADEIVVVVDAKSSDRSEAIAAQRATRHEVRPYEGDLEQKSYCASLATGDWVLVIDPDEVMPPALAQAIARALARDLRGEAAGEGDAAGPDAFELNRRTWHLGRWLEHGDFFPDWTLRLYRRERGRWEGDNPHARVTVPGRVGRLEPPLEHYSYRDLSDQIERIQHFSEQAAHAMRARGRRAGIVDLALRPPARFLRGYLLRHGFLDGTAGLVVAAASAFHVFLKYAKLWELERRERG